jgi:acetyl esterase/lipase
MAKEWQIDPNRIAATGGSAGAGISAWIAFHDEMANPESVHQRCCRVEKVREFAS